LVRAFPVKETDLWSYFLFLKSSRVATIKGFTVSSTFLETVRFCKFVMGFHDCDGVLSSKRLIGFSALEKKERGPLNQAPPLEVQHLLRLREILAKGSNAIDRIGAGAFLVCVYSLARWSDLRYVHHIKFDGYKRQARPQRLAFEGAVPAWLGWDLPATLCDQGFNFERVPFGPLLPVPKGENERYSRPLGANEGANWLSLLLAGCP